MPFLNDWLSKIKKDKEREIEVSLAAWELSPSGEYTLDVVGQKYFSSHTSMANEWVDEDGTLDFLLVPEPENLYCSTAVAVYAVCRVAVRPLVQVGYLPYLDSEEYFDKIKTLPKKERALLVRGKIFTQTGEGSRNGMWLDCPPASQLILEEEK